MNYFDELAFKTTIYKLSIIIIWTVAPYRNCNGDFLALPGLVKAPPTQLKRDRKKFYDIGPWIINLTAIFSHLSTPLTESTWSLDLEFKIIMFFSNFSRRN